MLVNRYFLLTIIFILSIIADYFWGENFFARLYKKWEELRSVLSAQFYRNGERLLAALLELDTHIYLGYPTDGLKLAKYKFYTAWIESVVLQVKRMGVSPSRYLRDITLALKDDLKFEKKIQQILGGALVQALAIMLLTWVFIFMASASNITIDGANYALILVVHLLGLIFIPLSFYYINYRALKDFRLFFSSLYRYRSFVEIGMSVNEIVSRSSIDQLFVLPNKHFKYILLRLKKINLKLHNGIAIKDDLNILIDDLISLRENKFFTLERLLNSFKFLLIILFYLLPYFYYIYELSNSLI